MNVLEILYTYYPFLLVFSVCSNVIGLIKIYQETFGSYLYQVHTDTDACDTHG